MKTEIVKRIERTLADGWVGMQPMELKISFTVIRKRHRFLFWTWTSYDVERDIPYVSNPFYDGEYSTNARLSALAKMMESEAVYAIRVAREHDECIESRS